MIGHAPAAVARAVAVGRALALALGPVLEPWMSSALQDPDRLVRKAAIDAFARMGRDESDELGTFRSEITDKNYNAMMVTKNCACGSHMKAKSMM